MKNRELPILILLFYAGWFGSVALERAGAGLYSPVFAALLIGIQIFRGHLSPARAAAAMGLTLAGVLFDSLALTSGMITARGAFPGLVPTWLITIWLLYSFSMMSIGPRLRLPWWAAGALGLIGGPLSYASGEALGVLSFSSPVAIPLYAVFWGLMFPVTLLLSKRDPGNATPERINS